MPAIIKQSEIRWSEPIRVRFGFAGIPKEHAVPIIRKLIDEEWPTIKRRKQCVYVIRLRGEVAIAYGETYSPVIYIGEGDAYGRLYSHAEWLASLLINVPNLEVEIHIAQIARKANYELYRYIEADMIKWFYEEFACLPWFNRQRERGKEGHYEYEVDAKKNLRRHIGVGSGNSFLWGIRPLPNNDQYKRYVKGNGNGGGSASS
ncbi:MAG: hypothetical protein V9G24_11645 [Rhodoblastus sp.]